VLASCTKINRARISSAGEGITASAAPMWGRQFQAQGRCSSVGQTQSAGCKLRRMARRTRHRSSSSKQVFLWKVQLRGSHGIRQLASGSTPLCGRSAAAASVASSKSEKRQQPWATWRGSSLTSGLAPAQLSHAQPCQCPDAMPYSYTPYVSPTSCIW
jgi:hypothetical protein